MTIGILLQTPSILPAVYENQCQWSGDGQPLRESILRRVLELVYTAWDLEPFAQEIGYTGPPFQWNEERRFMLRCELDAAFFHLYGINRDDLEYIMNTFPIVKRKDEQAYGEYRTKRIIIEIYDEMTGAMQTGGAYLTRLDPPPSRSKCGPSIRETAGLVEDLWTYSKLRESVVDEYKDYVESFVRIHDERVDDFVRTRLAAGELWPDAVLQLNPAFVARPHTRRTGLRRHNTP